MKKHSILILALFFACREPAQSVDPGPTGPRGATGEAGIMGPTGACDLSSCPSLTTINGLAGGSISGATTLQQAIVSDTLTLEAPTGATPHGIIVKRGGHQTSIGGFYCGQTMFTVSGAMYNAEHQYGTGTKGYDQRGLWVAKRHCEAACGHPAAHACTTTETRIWAALGAGIQGGTDDPRFPNVALPQLASGDGGWVISDVAGDSCDNATSEDAGKLGTSFSNTSGSGFLSRTACNVASPLLCCL